jgi:hypothetical protein
MSEYIINEVIPEIIEFFLASFSKFAEDFGNIFHVLKYHTNLVDTFPSRRIFIKIYLM